MILYLYSAISIAIQSACLTLIQQDRTPVFSRYSPHPPPPSLAPQQGISTWFFLKNHFNMRMLLQFSYLEWHPFR